MTKISFKGSKVLSLNFKTEKLDMEEGLKLNYQVLYSKDVNTEFMLRFDIKIISKDGILLELKYGAFFNTEEQITDEFKNGHFPTVNAPAIAYPYLRSFVSTLTINAGVEGILLPTINFKKLARETDIKN